MCGIIGVYLKDITERQLKIIAKIIVQSGIRGVHATGISYCQSGKILTKSSHIGAKSFMEDFSLKDCIDKDGGLYLIAHTRYSTSDLRYNQPIGDNKLSIVHNGVISQEPRRNWKKLFGLNTKTTNDSELIYSCLKSGIEPLKHFDGSMAVCILVDKEVTAFRNHERPLWFQEFGNGIIFASTEDILFRSDCATPQKCKMFNVYSYRKNGLVITPYEVPLGVKDLQ